MRSIVVVLVALAADARADVTKLGGGYEIVDDGGHVDVRKGKRRATLSWMSGGVENHDATKRSVTLRVGAREPCTSGTALTFTYDQLEARLVNTEALVLHRKKLWAKAAPLFEKAITLDPAWPLPAYNAAAAYTRATQIDKALATLDPWLTKDPVATLYQIATDAELQPLMAMPPIASRLPAKGTFASGELYAYSPSLHAIALRVSASGYLSCTGPATMRLYDVKTGADLFAIEQPCKETKAAAAKREAAITSGLAALGFSATPVVQESAVDDEKANKRIVRMTTPPLKGVPNAAGGVNIWRDNKIVAQSPNMAGWLSSMDYIAAANAVVIRSYLPSDECARSDASVVPLP